MDFIKDPVLFTVSGTGLTMTDGLKYTQLPPDFRLNSLDFNFTADSSYIGKELNREITMTFVLYSGTTKTLVLKVE
jgi:hypothetical protein